MLPRAARSPCHTTADLHAAIRGQISLSKYTDPGFFLRLWVEQMRAETEQQRKKRRKVKAHVGPG